MISLLWVGAQQTECFVDTRATISNIHKFYLTERVIYPTNTSIVSVNGKQTKCYCQLMLNMSLHSLRSKFIWSFAEIAKVLIGSDFNYFYLSLDSTNYQFIDSIAKRLVSEQH